MKAFFFFWRDDQPRTNSGWQPSAAQFSAAKSFRYDFWLIPSQKTLS